MKIWYHTHQLPDTFTHFHVDFEIMYCVEGSYSFHYMNAAGIRKTECITPKNMIFIPKGLYHGIENVSYPYSRYFLHLPVSQTIELLDSTFMLSPFQTYFMHAGKEIYVPRILQTGTLSDKIEKIFERMINVYMTPALNNSCNELHLRSLLGLMFCELYESHRDFFTGPRSVKGHIANEVRRYIDENYDQQLNISELAREHFVHPSYLSHIFANQVGLSPRKYLTNLRLSNARKLLLSSENTIQSISAKVGFPDVNNFIQSFKKSFGITPKQYRKKMLSEFNG